MFVLTILLSNSSESRVYVSQDCCGNLDAKGGSHKSHLTNGSSGYSRHAADVSVAVSFVLILEVEWRRVVATSVGVFIQVAARQQATKCSRDGKNFR